MSQAHAVYECPACHLRRDVTIVGDPDPTQVSQLLRHASCPACKARDPQAVAAHRREVWRGRFTMAAVYAGIALAAVFAPKVALLPPAIGLLIWALALRIRLRRRFWVAIVVEPLIAAAMSAWIIAVPHRAYLVPVALALLAFLPRASSSDPFADAAEQLRFAGSPYRG